MTENLIISCVRTKRRFPWLTSTASLHHGCLRWFFLSHNAAWVRWVKGNWYTPISRSNIKNKHKMVNKRNRCLMETEILVLADALCLVWRLQFPRVCFLPWSINSKREINRYGTSRVFSRSRLHQSYIRTLSTAGESGNLPKTHYDHIRRLKSSFHSIYKTIVRVRLIVSGVPDKSNPSTARILEE